MAGHAEKGILNFTIGDGAGQADSPALNFGDGDTGFYESVDDELILAVNGLTSLTFRSGVGMEGTNAAGPGFLNKAATDVVPTLTANKSDNNSGLGQAAADAPSIIAGAIEAIRFTEATNHVLQKVDAEVGVTADAGSIQGGHPLISSYTVIDTSGTAGDSVTLPAVAPVGTICHIKNGAAANSVDVFPAAGDDAGAGANTAVALAAGAFAVYICTTANTTWEKFMGGTA